MHAAGDDGGSRFQPSVESPEENAELLLNSELSTAHFPTFADQHAALSAVCPPRVWPDGGAPVRSLTGATATSTGTITAPYLPLLRAAVQHRTVKRPVDTLTEQEHTRGAGEPPAARPALGRSWAFA